jgi:hypothetical protein
LPYAILTCELLTNDYFLHTYIQSQSRLLNENKILNKNNLKEHFYNVIQKELQQQIENRINKSVEHEKSKQQQKSINRSKDIKFNITIGDHKTTRIDSSESQIVKKYKKSLFEHIDALNSSNSTNNHCVNLLGINVNNENNGNNNQKVAFKFPKIPINTIKKLPPIDLISAPKPNLTSRFQQTSRKEKLKSVPEHDYINSSLIEGLKINSYKINSLLANEINNEFNYIDDANKLLESQNHNRLSKYFSRLNKHYLQSSSIEFERSLFEKFSLINNKFNTNYQNNTIQVRENHPKTQASSAIHTSDSITENLDTELLFDLNQNLNNDENNILNFDRDLFNSICNDIKEIGSSLPTTNEDLLNVNQTQTVNSQIQIEEPVYSMKRFTKYFEEKTINSKLLINGISRKNLEQNDNFDKLLVDPRYFNIIDKFTKKLKLVFNFFYQQQQQHQQADETFNEELNKFFEKCEKKLKKDSKGVPVNQLIEIIKLVDLNIDFLNKTNYSNLRMDFGETANKNELKTEFISNIFSYDYYLNELKMHLFQFFEYFFLDIFTSSKWISSILHAKARVIDDKDLNGVDPRQYGAIISKINIQNVLFFTKSFHIVKNEYKLSEKTSQEKLIAEEIDISNSSILDFLQSSNNTYNDCIVDMEVDYDDINLDHPNHQFPTDLSDILNDEIVSIEITKLIDVLNQNSSKPEKKEEKISIKPFKINNQSSLISEIHSVFEKEKKEKKTKKGLIKRERSKSEINEPEKIIDKKSSRSMSVSNKIDVKIELKSQELEKASETQKLFNIIDKIEENKADENENSENSDRDENYVSIKLCNQNDSNLTTSKIEINNSINNNNNNNNVTHYDNFRFKKIPYFNETKSSKNSNNIKKRGSKSPLNRSRSANRNQSRSPTTKEKRSTKRRSYSRSRSRSKSRTRRFRSKLDRHKDKLDRSYSNDELEISKRSPYRRRARSPSRSRKQNRNVFHRKSRSRTRSRDRSRSRRRKSNTRFKNYKYSNSPPKIDNSPKTKTADRSVTPTSTTSSSSSSTNKSGKLTKPTQNNNEIKPENKLINLYNYSSTYNSTDFIQHPQTMMFNPFQQPQNCFNLPNAPPFQQPFIICMNPAYIPPPIHHQPPLLNSPPRFSNQYNNLRYIQPQEQFPKLLSLTPSSVRSNNFLKISPKVPSSEQNKM